MPSTRKRGNQQRNNELPVPRGRPPKRRAETSQTRSRRENNVAVSSQVSSVDNNPQSCDNLPPFSADQLATLRTMIQDTVAESSRYIATEAARAAVTALLNQNSVAVGTTLQSDTNPRGATNQPRPTTSLGDPNPLCDNAESPQLPASSVQNQDIPASYVKDIQSDGSVQGASTPCQPRSMSGPTRTPADLMDDIRCYLNLSIANSTKHTYSTGGKSFIKFLSLYRPLHAQSLPTDEDTLILYVAYLAKSVKHSTIKGYLAAVCHFHIRRGYQLNLRKFLRLHLVCRGIKRSQGSSIRTRLPITVSHLKFFYSLLAIRYTANFGSLMIWAAMTLAFFGFMRLGELTCNSQFSSDAHLTPLDIIFHPSQSNPSHILVKVKVSKTDPFRMGHTLLIGQTNQSICLVNAMKLYLTRRGTAPGPLFIFASGRPLTKDACINC